MNTNRRFRDAVLLAALLSSLAGAPRLHAITFYGSDCDGTLPCGKSCTDDATGAPSTCGATGNRHCGSGCLQARAIPASVGRLQDDRAAGAAICPVSGMLQRPGLKPETPERTPLTLFGYCCDPYVGAWCVYEPYEGCNGYFYTSYQRCAQACPQP